MMKKLAVLMTLACIGLGAVVVKFKIQGDNRGPEITFYNADLTYHTDMTEAKLLEDAVATDAVEGDVSAMTVIENIYKVSEEQVVVVYVAKDSNNNITKVKRPLALEEEKKVKEEKIADVKEEIESQTAADEITPTPVTTFGLTDAEMEQETDNEETAESSTEEDAAEETEAERMRTEQEAIADAMSAACPKVYLTDYRIEVPLGTTIDALSYVKEIKDDADDVLELWKKIQLRDAQGNQASSAISCTTAGTYEYTFLVVDSQNNVSNSAVLTIVVK